MSKLFLSLLLTIFSVELFAQKAPFPPQLQNTTNAARGLAMKFIQGSEADKFYPEDMEDDLGDTAEELYKNGIAKLTHLEDFECRLEELKKFEEIRSSKSNPVDYRCYKNFVEAFSSTCNKDVTFSEIFPIVDASEDTFYKKYQCQGVTSYPNPVPVFEKEKGLYFLLYKKLLENFLNQVKDDTQKLAGEYEMASVKQCKQDLYRLPFAGFKAPQTSPTCKISQSECTKHSECCSQYCLKENTDENPDGPGVCGPEISCYKLIAREQECGMLDGGKINPYCDNALLRHQLNPNIPAPDPSVRLEQCIETNYNTSEMGECTPAGKSYTTEKPCCSDKVGSDGKCVLKMTCDSCAKGGTKVNANEKCCPGYYRSLKDICIQDFPPLILPETTKIEKKPKGLIERIFDFILPSAFAASDAVCLNGVNCQSTLNAEQQAQYEASVKMCLATEDLEKKEQCLKEATEFKNQLINQNIQDGATGELWDRQKYLSQFNMSAITAKTASDFKKCEFNSFNDSWISAMPMERNAEIVIRGFEYLFSGKGTVDYWLDPSGKSIYERAKAVASKVRKYRTELIKNYQEIDRQMACKCIAITGAQNYPDKMDFFNSQCASERSELSSSLKGADGSSAQDNLSKLEKDQATMSEIDLGAAGISQEKLVIEYLELRMSAQLDRFRANAELEEALSELSQFIIDNQWEQSWTTKRVDSPTLYEFKVKRLAGWVSWAVGIFAAVVIGVIGIATFGAGWVVISIVASVALTVGGSIQSGMEGYRQEQEAMLQEYFSGASTRSIFGEGTTRFIDDQVIRDWYTEGMAFWREYKKFRRYYRGPYFKTTHPDSKMGVSSITPDKICEVHASSTVCFKNVFATTFEEDVRFLLDVKFPEFVAEEAYESDSQFIKKVNEGYQRGINALRATRPLPVGWAKKVSWIEENMLEREAVKKAFKLDSGSWTPKVFTQANEEALKNGAKKYATCIRLKDCGAKNLEGEEDVFGFGFLFEDEVDVNHFAEYVYQHHFKWPSLSASGYMRYPTMALSSYFEAIVYNLRIIGSLAVNNSNNFGEMYDAYKEDYEKRVNYYKQNAAAEMGKTKNIKYSKKFRDAFKKLNFKVGANVEEIYTSDGKLKNVEGFSSAELKTYEAGAKMALRAAEQQKKRAHYMASVGQTARGKIKMNAQNEFMKKFAQPLRTMPLSIGGRQLGMTGDDTGANSSTTSSSQKLAAYTPKIPNFKTDFNLPSYSNSFDGNDSTSSDSSVPKTGLRHEGSENHRFLIESAENSQHLFKRDDADSLFQIVSKAYYRNLSLILVQASDKKIENDGLVIEKKQKIDDKKKSELKKLLGD